MVTFAQLRHTSVEPMDRAGDTWNSVSGHVEQVATQVRSGILRPLTGAGPNPYAPSGHRPWTGAAADEATREIGLLADELSAFHYEALAVTATLRRARSAFAEARQNLLRAITDTESLGAAVAEDGTVTLPDLPPGERNDPDAIAYRKRTWDEVQQHVETMRKAVAAATEADATAAASLRTINPDEVNPATRTTAVADARADVMGAVGMPKDRNAVPAWWATVDPAVRAQLMEMAPAQLAEAGVLDPTYRWRAPDSGAGPFNSRTSGVDEVRIAALAEGLVLGGTFSGREDAARHMQHYLDGSGTPVGVDVDRMLREDARFRSHVQGLLTTNDAAWRQTALDAYRKAGGSPVAVPVETARTQENDYTFDQDAQPNWFTAIGSQACVVSGLVTVKPGSNGEPVVSMQYQVNVWDRYNWDPGKSTDIAGTNITDSDMAKLHQTGMAREFDIKGNSTVSSRSVGDGSATPPAGTGERHTDREGTATDPGRQPR
ncbi:hypothetical protein OH807_15360 [Kitasatospora sp. NBC_01560]|uniref:hypothetical protein n=1 Tax=Kitasatospora sp. NBC_01560 TaxID=2975965 RepID=UPI0038637AC9